MTPREGAGRSGTSTVDETTVRRSAYDSTGVFVTFMFRDDRSYERGRATVLAGNHDFSTEDDPNRSVLGVGFYDNGDMPIEALDRLAFEIKHTMQDRLRLEFCRVDPARSLCDEEYALLEPRCSAQTVCH